MTTSQSTPITVPDKLIRVAVGVLCENNRVLAQQRVVNPEKGKWEFPGGKLDGEENGFDALVRELHEELGIRVSQAEWLLEVEHYYGHGHVHLDVWWLDKFNGKAHSREGQPIKWVDYNQLLALDFLQGNTAIVQAVGERLL